jgi:hypothetical protein
MSDELPAPLLESLKNKERAQMKHNWMYSFMPAAMNQIYLVGYCKVCNQSVSANVPYSPRNVTVRFMDIPKWGCIPDQEI